MGIASPLNLDPYPLTCTLWSALTGLPLDTVPRSGNEPRIILAQVLFEVCRILAMLS
jgi:hypothetical protein